MRCRRRETLEWLFSVAPLKKATRGYFCKHGINFPILTIHICLRCILWFVTALLAHPSCSGLQVSSEIVSHSKRFVSIAYGTARYPSLKALRYWIWFSKYLSAPFQRSLRFKSPQLNYFWRRRPSPAQLFIRTIWKLFPTLLCLVIYLKAKTSKAC